MTFKRYTGEEPQEVIYIRVRRTEADETVGSLHRSGPVRGGSEFLFLPDGDMPVPEAIMRAEPLSIKHDAPVVIKVEEGADWDERWGHLS